MDPTGSRRPAEISVYSRLDAPPDQVWDRVMTPEGINDEMRPYLRMTLPRGVERLDPESIEVGVPIGRSWILLFGLLPFDYDEVCLVRLDPGRGFLERSKMLPAPLGARTHDRAGRRRLPDHRPGELAAAAGPARAPFAPGDRLVLSPPPRAAAAPLRRRRHLRTAPPLSRSARPGSGSRHCERAARRASMPPHPIVRQAPGRRRRRPSVAGARPLSR